MAGLRDVFFDSSVLVAGMIDFGRSSHHALLLMDAVADGRIEHPLTAWHCCLEFYSVTTRLPEEYRLARPAPRGRSRPLSGTWNGASCREEIQLVPAPACRRADDLAGGVEHERFDLMPVDHPRAPVVDA